MLCPVDIQAFWVAFWVIAPVMAGVVIAILLAAVGAGLLQKRSFGLRVLGVVLMVTMILLAAAIGFYLVFAIMCYL